MFLFFPWDLHFGVFCIFSWALAYNDIVGYSDTDVEVESYPVEVENPPDSGDETDYYQFEGDGEFYEVSE